MYCYRVSADGNDSYASAFLQQRPNDYGIPVAVEVTYVQDNFLTSDVLNEMVLRRHRCVISKWCQTCYQNVFICLFLCADVACWLLQGSAWPHPVQPVLVSWHDHVGQDQSRTTSAGHTPDDIKPNCVCVCGIILLLLIELDSAQTPICKYQMGLILTIARRSASHRVPTIPNEEEQTFLNHHRWKIKIVRETWQYLWSCL